MINSFFSVIEEIDIQMHRHSDARTDTDKNNTLLHQRGWRAWYKATSTRTVLTYRRASVNLLRYKHIIVSRNR